MIIFYFILAAIAENPNTQLQRSFEREFAYVQAEKRTLEKQLSTAQTQNQKHLTRLENEIISLEGQLAKSKSQLLADNERFIALEKQVNSSQNIATSFQSTLLQASESVNIPLGDASSSEQYSMLFDEMLTQIQKERQVRQEDGIFYLEDGSEAQGKILHIGQTATFGQSDAFTGALLPIGDGKFKVIPELGEQTAEDLFAGNTPQQASFFLTEGFQKPIVISEERTVVETLNAGGVIAWVIVILGMIGLLLGCVRALILLRSPISRLQSDSAVQNIQDAKNPTAIPLLQNLWNSTTTSHDALLDEAEAAMLKEQTQLERFGTAILVIAAIAPLLGLLGTVTGMISTFEIITEHGTGDPRMLSGGISEALITTQLGLVVAIPMLLLGNILGGWASRMLSKLESVVLLLIAEKSSS